MKRTPRLLLGLIAPLLLAWSASAIAQNCSNGNAKYHLKLGGMDASCSQSSCHGNDPKDDKNRILAGAQVVNIENALQSVNEMMGLDTALGLLPSDLEDIAYYISFRANNQQCPAATANVSANPTSAAFGNQAVGTSSASQTVTVSNTGAAASPALTFPAAPTHFTRGGTCANGALAAGASCTLIFTFSPTAAGTFSSNYTVGGVAGVSVALSGTGVAASGNLQLSPTTASFGAVVVGQTAVAQQIIVTNVGGAQATGISFTNSNAAEFLVSGNTCGATLAANNGTCVFNVAYKPSAAGIDNATITISYAGGSVALTMSGSGTAPAAAQLGAAPGSLAFGSVTVGATSATQSVTVTNTGGATASNVSIANSNAAEFLVSGSSCGASLAAGASCSFSVAYKPAAAGADSASISISYTGGVAATVSLSGTGTAPATPNVQAAPGSLAFGSVTVGATAAAKTVTVSNTGGASATGLAVASSDAAKFPVSANTCGATLAAGASCTVNVGYAPAAAGADSGTLTVSYTGGTPVAVAMTGTGTAAPTANLAAAPAPVAFGNVTVGQTSAATTVTVSNGGTAAATGVAFANSNAAEFPVSGNTCGATIAAGASCTFAVAYSPAAAGADSATITITYAGGGAVSVALSGTGVTGTPPPGTGQLSLPAAATFGSQGVGTASAAQTITVSNTGGAAVTVSAITSSSAEFAVSAVSCGVVNAGASCSFALTFTPAAAGSRSATITVASNGAGSPQAIAASGTGVAGGTPPPGTTAEAIEYYHAEFDHYFITAIADEITKIDNGTFKGWARTGKSFKVHPGAAAGLNAVCRFFSTAFGAKSSHFYTPNAPECDVVKANPNWQFEAEVFHVVYPAFDGSCPAGTIPVYRVYNNGQSGAPNHRYTTEMAVRNAMLALGWIAEGAGTIGVIMCAPQ